MVVTHDVDLPPSTPGILCWWPGHGYWQGRQIRNAVGPYLLFAQTGKLFNNLVDGVVTLEQGCTVLRHLVLGK
ncbi:hypothetical protein [Desulfofarcimen acetoxidans]|uniref:hypothetical protein n=1 Tax=Desulfofarcimen acetoxidans TaxID=58138 RepID=UPI000318816D|nr:hypothetical protein [Desulfofarcimen acetoxidans]